MKRLTFSIFSLMMGPLCALPAIAAEFTLKDDGTHVLIEDLGKPVIGYRYAPRLAETPSRDAHYLYPIRGLSGEEIGAESGTGNGHSGIFWTWRNGRSGDRLLDIWDGRTATRLFERWVTKSARGNDAELGVQSVWVFEDTGDAQIMETLFIRMTGFDQNSRWADLSILLRNVSSREIEVGGSGAIEGLCLQLNTELSNVTLSTSQGVVDTLLTNVMSPWMDISYRDARRSSYSGLAIFQHPKNPGFSGPNWNVGQQGLVAVGMTPSDRFKLQPGETLRFSYRIFFHRGFGPNLDLDHAYSLFLRDSERSDEQ